MLGKYSHLTAQGFTRNQGKDLPTQVTKKSGLFDKTMGAYDVAEVCGIFLLNQAPFE